MILSHNGITDWESDKIPASATALEMKQGLQPYYSKYYWNIEVFKTDYDQVGNVTANASLISKSVYTVSLLNQIEGFSASAVSVSTVKTKAKVSVVAPKNGQASSAPLSGFFKISCTDEYGKVWSTDKKIVDQSSGHLEYHMKENIPFLMDKITTWDDYRYERF